MASGNKPQSDWLTSFLGFSLLACVSLAAVAGGVVYLAKRVSKRLEGRSAQVAPVDLRPDVRLPSEAVGWDSVVSNLLSAFDHADIIALGDTHGSKADSDLRLRLVRDPDFPFRVNTIVVEFGNSLYQSLLDQYINGGDLPLVDLQQIWQDTTQVGSFDSPVYAEFYAAVREVNRKLPAGRRLRVIAGDPPIEWSKVKTKSDMEPFLLRRDGPVSLYRSAVQRSEKALVIYDNAALKRPAFPLWAAADEVKADPHAEALLPLTTPQFSRAVQAIHTGRVFVVRTIAGADPFGSGLQSTERPVLVPLTGLHAIGAGKLGDEADACVYFGDAAGAGAVVSPNPAIYGNTPYGQEIARRKLLR